MKSGAKINPPKLCIVMQGEEIGYSETFIASHSKRLFDGVPVLFGRPGFRTSSINDVLYSKSKFSKGLRWIGRWLTRRSVLEQEAKYISKFFRRHDVNVVLAEYGVSGCEILDACHEAGVPLIVHFHGYDAYRTDLLASLAPSYKRLFEVAKAVIAVSRDMREQLIRLGADPKKVVWIPCGADSVSPPMVQKILTSKVHGQIVCVGRFVEKKQPVLSFLAFALNANKFPQSTLVMIGEGPLLNQVRMLCAAFRLESRVRFLGATDHGNVIEFLRASTVFLQHSVRAADGDCEGTPVAVVEAQANACAVVATRHGGISDIVIGGKTGILVDEWDLIGMKDALAKVLDNESLAKEMGRNGASEIRENWSLNINIERIEHLVSSVVNGLKLATPELVTDADPQQK